MQQVQAQSIYFKLDEIFTNESYVFDKHSQYYHQPESKKAQEELERKIIGLIENIDKLFCELSSEQIVLNT